MMMMLDIIVMLMGLTMKVLDFLPWGFLNGNLDGDAWITFDVVNCPSGHRGLEVWRRLMTDVIRKTHSERLFMEAQVTQPAACNRLLIAGHKEYKHLQSLAVATQIARDTPTPKP